MVLVYPGPALATLQAEPPVSHASGLAGGNQAAEIRKTETALSLARSLLQEAKRPGLTATERKEQRVEAVRTARRFLDTELDGTRGIAQVPYLQVIAEALVDLENMESAWLALERLLRLNGADPVTQFLLASWLGSNQRFDECAVTLGKAIDLGYAPRERAVAERAYCVASAGKTEEGNKLADEAVQINPAAFYPHFIRGWVLAQTDKLPEAITSYRTAVSIDDTDINLLGFFSEALERQGDYEQSFKMCFRACEVQPGFHWCSIRMQVLLDHLAPTVAEVVQASKLLRNAARMPGQTSLERFKFKKAAMEKVMSLVPGGEDAATWIRNADLLREYNEVALAMDMGEVSIKVASRLLKEDPEHPENSLLMARAYATVENHTEALPYYQKALDLGVGDPVWTRTRYTYSLGKLGRFKEAHAIVDEAMRIAPTFYKGPFLKGWLFEMEGKTAEAIDWYEKATLLYDKDADVWAFLGDLYEERKEYGKAVGCFRKLLEAKPDEPVYSEKLRKLETVLRK